jgi:iron complex outermembrane receptor protein
VAILNLAKEQAETYRAVGNMQAEYRMPWIEGLRANVTLGIDASDGKRRNFAPSVLHREQATGRGGQQTRFNPQQTSTVL